MCDEGKDKGEGESEGSVGERQTELGLCLQRMSGSSIEASSLRANVLSSTRTSGFELWAQS